MALFLSAAVTAIACGASRQERVRDPRGPAGRPLEMLPVPGQVAAGLSGATVDDNGRLWLVPEEQRVLVRLDLAEESIRTVPLRGVDHDIDTEAIAWIGGDRFAIGTESTDDDRVADPILFATLEDGEARVERRVRCPYELWGLEGESNEGIEGLCYADGRLLLALELVGTTDGRRWAPLAAYDMRSKRWTSHRMWLTSGSGKVSALACQARDDGAMDVLAIERHFEVSNLLRMTLPAEEGDISPEPLLDLLELTSSDANFEGLGWLPSGEVAVVQDNHYGEITTRASAIVLLPPRLLDRESRGAASGPIHD